MNKRSMLQAAVALACATLSLGAFADRYPSKPIRLIVAFPPGGNADLVARAVADKLGQELNTTIVVDNRAGGAAGVVGTAELARLPADGYTIGIATVGTMGTPPAVTAKLPYDPLKDFTYISNMASVPMLLAVGPSIKQKTLQELVAELRDPAKEHSYASGGNGGIAHLMGELFKSTTGAKMLHIPYKGSNPALNDVAGGQVDMIFDAVVSSTPYLQGGRVRAIAVSGKQRAASLPDVPTFAEAGFPEVSTEVWYGIVGPANMPEQTVDVLYKAIRKVLAMPEVQQRFERQGTTPVGNTPAEFRQQVQVEVAKWKRIATAQRITVD